MLQQRGQGWFVWAGGMACAERECLVLALLTLFGFGSMRSLFEVVKEVAERRQDFFA